MKQLFTITLLSIALFSCNSNKKQEQTNETTQTGVAAVPVFELDSLLKVADQFIDKQVEVIGYVTHTCKHSGKRCFIVGNSQKTSFRVEAKGEIGGFNRELVGSKLGITGVLKERRLTKEYIDQMEKSVNEKKEKEDGAAENCQAELNNINEMRALMKEAGRDYYSVYYMDGENYEVLN